MTGGRRRTGEFRRKRETAHLTRFKQSGTSRLPSETRRRPFIRCAPPRRRRRRLFYLLLLLSILFETSAFQNGALPKAPSAITAMAAEALFAYWERRESCRMEPPRSGRLWRRRRRRAAERYLITAPDRLLLSFTYERPLYRGLADQMNPRDALRLPAGTQTLAALWQVWRHQRQRRSELIGEKLPTRSPASFLFK